MKLVLASRNKKKIAEMQKLLADVIPQAQILSLDDIGYAGEIEETGTSCEENSLIKAKQALLHCGFASIADDSGLCVDALDGRPGVYSSRYAGEGASEDECIDKLLDEMADVSDEKRTARFVSVITCCLPDGEVIQVRGECEGIITRSRRGEGRFGYDPVFYYPPFGKTFAELEMSIKNTVSHRAAAMHKFADIVGNHSKFINYYCKENI